ncbi:Uncharacterized protein APZ42_015188 [Daphnia magna]|uniref:Uncharacterized protein n=1 Tax=Daphnia magna TaxID=35525 RepID=A0A162P7X9_9CRUS|nr:Uncharacterized protein APZ42_015188 [Daphnia magna]
MGRSASHVNRLLGQTRISVDPVFPVSFSAGENKRIKKKRKRFKCINNVRVKYQKNTKTGHFHGLFC